MIIYTAISKFTGGLMSGAKGQFAFDNKATLGRSIGQNYRWEAHKAGIKPKDMYYIHEIDVNRTIQTDTTPFVVTENINTRMEYGEEEDCSVEVSGDGFSLSFGEGEPEDMTLGRDLSDAYSIADALELAHRAGLEGRPFEYKLVGEDE